MKKYSVKKEWAVKINQRNNYCERNCFNTNKNAQEVRIEISGYYFSVFANQSQATREVNCFVDAVI